MKTVLACVSLLVLAACNLSSANMSQPQQIGIDAPAEGAVLPMAPTTIVAHASDPTGVVEIEFSVNGAVAGRATGSGPAIAAQLAWVPPAAGAYIIQARARNSAGSWSSYAEVHVTVQGAQPPQPQQATPGVPASAVTDTPAPPAATETPSAPMLTLALNANCRKGPSQVYGVVTSLLAGQSVPIVAKSEEGVWWLVHIPTGEYCWIGGATGTAAGSVGTLPIATAEFGCFVYVSGEPVCTIPCPKHAIPGDQCTP